jgi:hypothetical protein
MHAATVPLCCIAFASSLPGQSRPEVFFQKGVNFTAESPGGYRPDAAVKMLDRLHDVGVNAIALVPYGFCSRTEPVIRFGGGWERAESIEAIVGLAHQRGIKVMLKPQLWAHGAFPGDLHFERGGERATWFENYRLFMEFYASLAARSHADLFCVGVEFVQMSRYESEWRKLIARARQLYPGPLVYAATQGPEFEGVRFWDALDYIGLNDYYPLPDDLSTDAVVRKVELVQRKFNKPVIFPEAGFPSLKDPHREPWSESPRPISLADQAKCYEAVLRAFYKKPWFQGVYWWKVGSNGRGGPQDGSHSPWGKPAMEIVARWYKNGGR